MRGLAAAQQLSIIRAFTAKNINLISKHLTLNLKLAASHSDVYMYSIVEHALLLSTYQSFKALGHAVQGLAAAVLVLFRCRLIFSPKARVFWSSLLLYQH